MWQLALLIAFLVALTAAALYGHFHPVPEPTEKMVDVCPVCEHARGEQAPPDLEESIRQMSLRLRGRPLRPARCGSTIGTAHVITPCTCRHPFHGS